MRSLNQDSQGSGRSSADVEKDARAAELPTTAASPESTVSITEEAIDQQDLKESRENPNVVDWDGPSDDSNPRNWSPSRKWTTIGIVSALTFNLALSATILAPGVSSAMKEFHTNKSAEGSLVVSIYVIGMAIGPLFLAPLSELYGRNWITHVSNVVFVVSTVLSAVSVNVGMLTAFRLFMGLSSSAQATLGGGFIADLMVQEERGKAYMFWVSGPLLGPVLGPILGGYISMDVGWRWTLWLPAIVGGITTILAFLILRETYAPRILDRKVQRLRKSTKNYQLRSKFDKGLAPWQLFRLAIIRPTKLFFLSPIVCLLCLFAAITYSYFYLLFTIFTEIFQDHYDFNTGAAGLAYLGMGTGFCIAQVSVGTLSDRYVVRQKNRRIKEGDENAAAKAEDRLPPLIAGAFLVPFGLFWFGWTVQYHVHWIAPIIGTGLCGVGIYFVLIPIQLYLVDAFPLYAASAIAANVVVRSIFGAVLPLAGPALYERLGVGWGNTLLGFLALVFAPCSIFLLKYGEAIRSNPKYQVDL